MLILFFIKAYHDSLTLLRNLKIKMCVNVLAEQYCKGLMSSRLSVRHKYSLFKAVEKRSPIFQVPTNTDICLSSFFLGPCVFIICWTS